MNNFTKHLFLISTTILIISCATSTDDKYQQTGGLKTIPLPPQRLNEKNVPPPVIANPANSKQNASATRTQSNSANTDSNPNAPYPQRIEETRANGEVTQIKVNNNGKVPPYYMYPSQQPDSNGRNTTDTSISTPSWQITW